MSNDITGEVRAFPSSSPSLEELSRTDCLALLGSVHVGRLGVSVEALPSILPVNFSLVGERILIRCVPGSKLDAAVAQQVVAFEADDFDPGGAWGWSVLVRGRGTELSDPAEIAEAEALAPRPWAFDEQVANRLLAIETTIVTGRRFRTPPR